MLLSSVSKVLDIEQVTVSDIGEWRRLGGTRGAIMKSNVGGGDGFWRLKYKPEFGRFEYPSKEETRLREAGQCLLCERRRDKLGTFMAQVDKWGEFDLSWRVEYSSHEGVLCPL